MAVFLNIATAIFGKVNEETPDHVVLQKANGYEVWRYPSSVSAVVYAADLPQEETDKKFTSAAFYLLANYIGVFTTPKNVAPGNAATDSSNAGEKVAMTAPVVITPEGGPEKVAMTAPVVISPSEEPEKIAMTAPVVMSDNTKSRGQSMKFLLPSKYKTVEQAPVPTDPKVKIELEPAGRIHAVLRFSGNLDMEGNAVQKAKELTGMLERDGVKVVGEWTAHGYNAPFVLPFLKRNEIHIPVDPVQFEEESG